MNLRSRGTGRLRATAVCLRPMTLRPHEDAMQRDAARARGQWEGVRARWGAGRSGGSSSVTGQADRAHCLAQPANSYQRQKYSLAQDTPALDIRRRLHLPCEPVLRASGRAQVVKDARGEALKGGHEINMRISPLVLRFRFFSLALNRRGGIRVREFD